MAQTEHATHTGHLEHHFETPAQQYDSAKLGMWLFLATEILLFGGLFCAYAVYRGNHPEVFVWAHHLLDTRLGAINTVILLTSSLTMAWAVRCSQLGQRTGLILLLALTLLGGCGFLGIKYVEYEAKWKHGLLWGREFRPDEHYVAEHFGEAGPVTDGGHSASSADSAVGAGSEEAAAPAGVATPEGAGAGPDAAPGEGAGSGGRGGSFEPERSTIRPAAAGPAGRAEPGTAGPHGGARRPSNVQVFFGIYFLMTGLHGLHVLAGMGVLAWLLVGAVRGRFGSEYFTPVDLGGLYWHLVDLIWIFLFPLLYLIH